jgi:hypothetical protein
MFDDGTVAIIIAVGFTAQLSGLGVLVLQAWLARQEASNFAREMRGEGQRLARILTRGSR